MADPSDTFDVNAVNAMAASAEAMTASLGAAQGNMQGLTNAMSSFVEMRERLMEAPLIDQDSVTNMQNLSELYQDVLQMGRDNVNSREREKAILKSMLSSLRGLNEEDKKKIKLVMKKRLEEKGMADLAEKVNTTGKDSEKSQEKIAKALKGQTRALSSSMASAAGVQMSLVGIIMLIVEGINNINRINALSHQVAGQWKDAEGNVKAAGKQIWELRKGFKVSYDEAAAYNKMLTKIGFEKEQLKKVNKELVALDFVQGVAIAESGDSVRKLMHNFNLTSDAALNTYLSVREISKEMGGSPLDISEVVNDWNEMNNLSRIYNTSIQTTIGFYNTLVRQDIAEKIGLGKVPLDIRRNLAKTFAGFSKDLSDGMQVALGKGDTQIEKMMEFRGASMEEQFKRMAEFLEKYTAGDTGAVKQYKVEQLLKTQFNFNDTEMQQVFAKAFAAGGFSGEKLNKVLGEIAGQRREMSNQEKDSANLRKKLIQEGQVTAKGLKTLQEQLKQWVQDNVITAIREVKTAIENIGGTLALFKSGGEIGEQIKKDPKGFLRDQKRQAESFLSDLANKGLTPQSAFDVATGKKTSIMQDKAYGGLSAFRNLPEDVSTKLLGKSGVGESLESMKSLYTGSGDMAHLSGEFNYLIKAAKAARRKDMNTTKAMLRAFKKEFEKDPLYQKAESYKHNRG